MGIVKTVVLRELVTAGAVARAEAHWVPGGYVLKVWVGLDQQTLEAQRGHIRRFKTLDSVASFAHEMGLSELRVDLSAYSRGRALL